jgi:hypothetical protein
MHMQMAGYSGARDTFEIYPDIEAVRMERRLEQLLSAFDTAPKVDQLFVGKLRERLYMPPWRYHNMAVIIRIDIQKADTAVSRKNHMVGFGVPGSVTENTGFLCPALHIFQSPGRPEAGFVHSHVSVEYSG